MFRRVATEEPSKDESVSTMQAGQPIERIAISSKSAPVPEEEIERGVGKAYDSMHLQSSTSSGAAFSKLISVLERYWSGSCMTLLSNHSAPHFLPSALPYVVPGPDFSLTLANRTTRRDLPKTYGPNHRPRYGDPIPFPAVDLALGIYERGRISLGDGVYSAMSTASALSHPLSL